MCLEKYAVTSSILFLNTFLGRFLKMAA